MPDPDLVVRTSGESRLSNFLLWQSAYAELVFSTRPGRILTKRILIPCSRSIRGVKGDSVQDRREGAVASATPVKSGNWKDLRARVLSAAVLIPCAGLCVWYGGLLYGAMIVLAMAGMAAEWARMFGFGRETRRGQLCVAWAACIGIAAVAGQWWGALLVMAAGLVLGPALGAGQVAIGCAGLSLLWLRTMSDPGRAWSCLSYPAWR